MTGDESPARLWAGRILSGLVVVALVVDAAVQLLAPQMMRAEMEATGFPMALAPVLGVLILICAFLYVVPRTSVLGAILVTGFSGGAIAIHFRLGSIVTLPQLMSLLLGVMAWAGLYLRDARLRALLPLVH